MIRQSESLVKLAPALVAAQAELEGVPKATRGQVGNAVRFYADLATVIEAVRGTLARHKLAYVQFPCDSDNGRVAVTTRLIHESGEWLEDTVSMPTGGNGAQGVGSALTYARRYSLMAVLGLAPEDDDGAAASAAQPRQRAPRAPQPPADPDKISAPQITAMAAAFNGIGIKDRDTRIRFICEAVGRQVATSTELTKHEASKVFDAIKAKEAA